MLEIAGEGTVVLLLLLLLLGNVVVETAVCDGDRSST